MQKIRTATFEDLDAIAAVVLFSIKDGSFVKKAEASWTSNAR